MKKLLFSALFVVAFAFAGSSQCTPGSYITPGIYPDTIENLPTAYVDLAYNAVVTAVIPVDTNLSGFDIPIDSIGIIAWTGYPPGFTYAANTPSGFWPGGSTGCILITGTPAFGDIGTYNLVFDIAGYVMGSPVPMTNQATGYKIIIKDTILGVSDNNSYGFALMPNTPNPFTSSTKIEFTSPSNETYQFSVISVIGDEVFSKNITAVTGKNHIEFSADGLPAGIYMYKLSNKTSTLTKRMIIKK